MTPLEMHSAMSEMEGMTMISLHTRALFFAGQTLNRR